MTSIRTAIAAGRLSAAALIAVVLALHSCVGMAPAIAEVRYEVSYETYAVRGLTASEIWRDIARKGPHQVERGLYAQAEAAIKFGWDVKFETVDGACRPTAATVKVETVILLPEWADQDRGSADLRAAWNRYIVKVRTHEDRHHVIAVAAAHEIERAALNTPSESTCAALEQAIKARAHTIFSRERAAQTRFDATDDPIMLIAPSRARPAGVLAPETGHQ